MSEPTLASDMLDGADAIAAFLGFKRQQIYHALRTKSIPAFRVGQKVCARKSTLLNWIAKQEEAAA